jgi:hypothetical protein
MKHVAFHIEDQHNAAITKLANHSGISFSAMLRRILDEYVNANQATINKISDESTEKLFGTTRRQHRVIEGEEKKFCARCQTWHTLDKFHKAKAWDGLHCNCKACKNETENHRRHRLSEEEKRQKYLLHKDRLNQRRRDRRKTDPAWAQKRRNKANAYRCKHHEKVLAGKRRYAQDPAVKAERCRKDKARRRSDPNFRLRANLRSRLWCALKTHKKLGRTFDLVGCPLGDLKKHLEAGFRDGMTWDNYGSSWHIDHIVPCAAFDLSTAEGQRTCFHFSNLQPLLVKENLAKKDRILPAA